MTDLFSEKNENEISAASFGSDSEVTSEETLYQILNVAPDATRLEIRESFLRLKKTYTAGNAALYSLISEDESNDALARLEEAFRSLNDSVTRRDYDLSMGFGKNHEPIDGAWSRDTRSNLSFHGGSSEHSNYTRPEYHSSSTSSFGYESETRSQHRPQMPIVKTKATKAGSETLGQEFKRLIEENDPSDGDLFRQLREAAGVSIEELQDRTKVSVCYITDIEANRFDRLPQLVYVKGFLRCIFKYLGVSESDHLVTAYAQRLQEWLTPKTN